MFFNVKDKFPNTNTQNNCFETISKCLVQNKFLCMQNPENES